MIIVQVNYIDKNVDCRPLFIDIVLGKLEHIIQKRCYLGFAQYRALIFLFRKLYQQFFFLGGAGVDAFCNHFGIFPAFEAVPKILNGCIHIFDGAFDVFDGKIIAVICAILSYL